MSKKTPKEPSLHLNLKNGKVICRLFSDIAPNHVKRIIELVEDKSYDNVVFHRVIEGLWLKLVMFNLATNYKDF